jgi:hypothetical protein
MKYADMNWGIMEAVVNKLGGTEGVGRFLSGELVVTPFANALKTWRTIKLGTGLETEVDFFNALRKSHCGIGDFAREMIGDVKSKAESEVELIVLSGDELGYKNCYIQHVYDRAVKLGLDLCPAEVGPQLRLQYADQPEGEEIFIAMNPIVDSERRHRIFCLSCTDGRRRLDSELYATLNSECRLIFRRRK